MSALISNPNKILRHGPAIFDGLILGAIVLFLIAHFQPSFLLQPSHAAGGDTPSHYYTLEYLKNVLLPQGRISGWTGSNYAGFPLLENYFALPFLLMVLLSYIMPMTVAFKIGTILGTLLLPIGAYIGFRAMRLAFPAPILAAISTLSFLFLDSNSLWGGNILSTLAGEFSYSFGLALTLVWLGTFYRGITSHKNVLLNSMLLATIGFSHGYTLVFCVVLASFFLLNREHAARHFVYLTQMYLLSFLFMGVWIIPMLLRTPWTTAYDAIWPRQAWNVIFPKILWPCVLLATLAFFRSPRRPALYLFASFLCGWLLYFIAPKMGVVDIRFLPFVQLMVCLLAALGVASSLGRSKAQALIPLIALLGTFWWVDRNNTQIAPWVSWNYSGFEAKTTWPTFAQVNALLKGSVSDPRVVYEHSPRQNELGTERAWETLPVFSGRSTLEHAYFQASPSAPFVFYLQSEISKETSCPFPDYGCTTPNLDHAAVHLRLFNVKDFIVISNEIKTALKTNPQYQKITEVAPYAIYSVTGPHHYVEALANEPILWTGGHWKQTAYVWFRNNKLSDVSLVFPLGSGKQERESFALQSDDLQKLPRHPLPPAEPVTAERLTNDELTFEAPTLHRPYLIKVSYHPAWKVEGAERIYLVSPAFMLVYPDQHHVRLYFSRTTGDYVGMLFALIGLGLAVWLFRRRKDIDIPESIGFRWIRRGTLAVAGCLGVYLISGAIQKRWNDPNAVIARGNILRSQKNWDASERDFSKVVENYPVSGLAEHAQYYIATSKFLREDWPASLVEFNHLLQRFPDGRYVAEGYYHIAMCEEHLGRHDEMIQTLQLLGREFPNTPWAQYARKRWGPNPR